MLFRSEWLYDNKGTKGEIKCPVCDIMLKKSAQGNRHILTHSELGAVYCCCKDKKHYSRIDSMRRHNPEKKLAQHVPRETVCGIRMLQAEHEELQFNHLLDLLLAVPSKQHAEYGMLCDIIISFRKACQRSGQKLDLRDKIVLEQYNMDLEYMDAVFERYPTNNNIGVVNYSLPTGNVVEEAYEDGDE